MSNNSQNGKGGDVSIEELRKYALQSEATILLFDMIIKLHVNQVDLGTKKRSIVGLKNNECCIDIVAVSRAIKKPLYNTVKALTDLCSEGFIDISPTHKISKLIKVGILDRDKPCNKKSDG